MTASDQSFPYHGPIEWLEPRTIFLTRHGSRAYGLATPESDTDYKGVAIPPRRYFLGFLKRFEQAEGRDPHPDLVIYGLHKFFKLATNANPNIIEVLWTEPEDHLVVTELGRVLLDHREAFLSQKIRHTFSGYALSQLKRIQRHHRWLHSPPVAPPERSAYRLPERSVLPRDQVLAAERQIALQLETWELDLEPFDPAARQHLQEQMARIFTELSLTSDARWRAAARCVGYDENFIDFLDRERKFREAQRTWKQFQEWKRNRNPKRAALEAQYGYDLKHALHLVRLLKICRRALETGEVRVKVDAQEREELLSIKAGAWRYEELVEWASAEDAALSEVQRRSSLPRSPDREALDALCQRLVEAMPEP